MIHCALLCPLGAVGARAQRRVADETLQELVQRRRLAAVKPRCSYSSGTWTKCVFDLVGGCAYGSGTTPCARLQN